MYGPMATGMEHRQETRWSGRGLVARGQQLPSWCNVLGWSSEEFENSTWNLVLLVKTVLGTLDATPKVPLYTDLTRGDTEVPGTTSSEAFLLS